MFLTPPTEEALTEEIRRQIGTALPSRLGVAVSGGSDSVALMHLLATLADEGTMQLHIATVDHGLRRESRQEAEAVAAQAAQLGLSHDILTWQEPTEEGNLQDAARTARYRLLEAWARGRGIDQVAVGHTADDQAETVLMRLRRASGVTGLGGMALRQVRGSLTLLRPMLHLRREDLRDYLTARGITWIEDPSNQDMRFERVRIRDALRALEPLGLTVEALGTVADNMRMADSALAQAMLTAARAMGQVRYGAVMIDADGFGTLPEDVARRLLLQAITFVNGPGYPPRRAPLQEALRAMEAGRGMTLQGCQIFKRGASFWICREARTVQDSCLSWPQGAAAAQLWAAAWRVQGPKDVAPGTEIRPLGAAGLRHIGDWRQFATPREVLMTLPSVWKGEEMLAAPLLFRSSEWTITALRPAETWAVNALSH